MLLVFTLLAVVGILVGAAFLATYEGEVLRDPHPDDRDAELPPGAVQPEDIAEIRFDLALRGYRMAEVDRVLHRLSSELAARDSRIAELEQALVDADDADDAADAVAPASGPLDTVPAEPEQTYGSPPVDVPPAPVVASAPVMTPVEEPEQTQEPEPAPEPEPEPLVASAPEETAAEEPEEPAPAAPEAFEPLAPPAAAPASISGPLTATTWFSEPAPVPEPVDVPEAPVEEPQLTLPASDDAFSFPELTPPPPAEPPAPEAAEEPAQETAQDASQDWWAQLQERPSGEGPHAP